MKFFYSQLPFPHSCHPQRSCQIYNSLWIITLKFVLFVVNSLIHCHGSAFGILHHFLGLLLQPAFLVGLRGDDDAMGLGVMVLVQIREGGKAVSGCFFRFAAPIHLCIYGEGRAPHVDHLALESDDIASEDGELEVDAVEHQQDRVLGVNILRHGEIGAFQEPLGAPSGEEGLVVVQIGELD